MQEDNKKLLLDLARRTVEAAVLGYDFSPGQTNNAELNVRCGCFVTLKTLGNLRGCLGVFTSNEPLYKTVCQMAKASATEDSRFFANQLTEEELSILEIEISVLSELRKTRDPLSLRPGIDGIYIKQGFATGCFLPQVLTETGWTVEEFLSNCCSHKAGIPEDSWQYPDTKVYLFTCEIIS